MPKISGEREAQPLARSGGGPKRAQRATAEGFTATKRGPGRGRPYWPAAAGSEFAARDGRSRISNAATGKGAGVVPLVCGPAVERSDWAVSVGEVRSISKRGALWADVPPAVHSRPRWPAFVQAYPRDVDLFIGALLGFAASLVLAFVGAQLQAKREHRRWVREKRYEHVQRVLRIASGEHWKHRNGDTFAVVRSQLADGSGDVDKIERRLVSLQEAVAELGLIGPVELHTLAVDLIERAADASAENNKDFVHAHTAFIVAAHRELGFDRA